VIVEGGVLHRVKREEELFGRRNVRVGICPGGLYPGGMSGFFGCSINVVVAV